SATLDAAARHATSGTRPLLRGHREIVVDGLPQSTWGHGLCASDGCGQHLEHEPRPRTLSGGAPWGRRPTRSDGQQTFEEGAAALHDRAVLLGVAIRRQRVELFAVAGQRRGQRLDGLVDQVAGVVGGRPWIVNETESGLVPTVAEVLHG